jgi:GrpB-like predicted nucleotidyltransferase (UPF0157 family)
VHSRIPEAKLPFVGTDTVVLVPYDEAWPSLYVEERLRIERALGSWVKGIEHVGSTAVPGVAAKPILDIMVGVRSLRDAKYCIRPLEQLGYEYRGEAGVPGRAFFRKGDPRTHHLHMTEIGSEFWERHLLLRDYLRAHPKTAREYAQLKHHLADRFGSDRAAYTEAKTGFISEVVRRATEEKGN